MTAVATIRPHLSGVQCPAELRLLPAWLMWRYEHHDDEPKPRKVPYWVNGQRRSGQQGGPEDRRHLTTFDAARTAAARRGMDGVGLALMPEWGLAALDFDNCILPDGALHPDVAEIAAQSYAEWSPSGHGVRVLFKGNLLNRKSFDPSFGFETFSTKGFVTFTGNRLDICEVLGNADTVADVTPEVMALYSRRFGQYEAREAEGHNDTVVGLTPAEIDSALTALDPDAPHDTWRDVGMALHHETRGEGFDYWHDWSERGAKYPGREALRRRWDSFGRYDGPQVTGGTLVRLAREAGVLIGSAAPASAEEFDEVDTEAETARAEAAEAAKPLRFEFKPLGSLVRDRRLEWIIKGVLPKAQLGAVYGASGSGKSFFALDMAMAIARGIPWRGKRVRQTRVAYVIAEGADGFTLRVKAYGERHELQDLDAIPLRGLTDAPNLRDAKEVKEVIRGLKAFGDVGLVIVDTLAQTTPGANENSSEDMSPAIKHCQAIHAATGAMVLLVHHSGKDAAKGMRGWSGIRGALDTELEVLKTPTGRTVELTKSKDGVDGLRWGFELETVVLGLDEDGDEITSCVVREADVPTAQTVSRKLGPVETVVNDVIQEYAKAQTAGIEVSAVLAEAARRLPEPASGARDTRRQRAKRALEALCLGDSAPYWKGDDGCLSVV